MSAPGRPKREYTSAKRETFICAPGRPKRETFICAPRLMRAKRSARHAGR